MRLQKPHHRTNLGPFLDPHCPELPHESLKKSSPSQRMGICILLLNLRALLVPKGLLLSSRPKSSNGPKTVNEVKRKAEILKDNRDYTFLFSDDAGAPHELSTKNCSQIRSVPSTSQPSSAKHIKEPSRGHLTGPNGISAPSSAKHNKEPSRGHLKGPNNSTTGTSTQRHSQQHIERQGTTRQPLPQSNRPKPISNGSHRPSPSTGAKRPPFDDNAIDMIRKMFKYVPRYHVLICSCGVD